MDAILGRVAALGIGFWQWLTTELWFRQFIDDFRATLYGHCAALYTLFIKGIEMPEVLALLRLAHIVPVVFMAAPLYMLIIVNERAQFGRAIDPKLDRYMESIISKQPNRCYAFLATVVLSGLLLLSVVGLGFGALVTNWVIAAKTVLTLALLGLLSYVHFGIQPKINALLAQANPHAPQDLGPRIWALRRRRKMLSCVCLFLVLTLVILGLRATLGYHPLLMLLCVALAAIFAYRCYSSLIPYGWV